MSKDQAPAVDRLGAPVPTPAGVDPARWAKFTAQVVMLPEDGCHLWTGRPRRSDGYGQFWAAAGDLDNGAADSTDLLPGLDALPAPAEADSKPRVWRAHRFAYATLTGRRIEPEDVLMHRCDQPLCVPITRDALDAHVTAADHRTNSQDRDHKGHTITPGYRGRTAWSRGPANGPVRRSLAINAALARALAVGVPRADLPAIIRAADLDATETDHPTLF